MPYILDVVEETTIKPVDNKIADFALNLLKTEADISYQKRDADGNSLVECYLPLDTLATAALIARIQELNDAGSNVYDSIKTAIHEAIAAHEGKSGSVV